MDNEKGEVIDSTSMDDVSLAEVFSAVHQLASWTHPSADELDSKDLRPSSAVPPCLDVYFHFCLEKMSMSVLLEFAVTKMMRTRVHSLHPRLIANVHYS